MISELVKTTTSQTIALCTDILDECIREDDERPLMIIVGKVMENLNPQKNWRGDQRVGDPVGIKNLCVEALDKRRNEKRGGTTSVDNQN